MLVLTRDEGEKVIITCDGTTIVVCAVQIRGDQVRLGFEAPKHVIIHREEVYEAIQASKRAQSGDDTGDASSDGA